MTDLLPLDRVPSVLGTTPDAVAALIEDGAITVEVDGLDEFVHYQHLRNGGLTGWTEPSSYAAGKGLTEDQVRSLARTGHVKSARPFTPVDDRLLVAQSSPKPSDEAIAATDDEIKEYRRQLDAERKANAARRKAESERSATSKLAERLGVDEDLLADALAEINN